MSNHVDVDSRLSSLVYKMETLMVGQSERIADLLKENHQLKVSLNVYQAANMRLEQELLTRRDP